MKQLARTLQRFRPHLTWLGLISAGLIIYLCSPSLALLILQNPPATWPQTLGPPLQDFLTLTLSIIVEATPFLILGIIISGLIRRFLPPARLVKLLPKQAVLRRLTLSMIGMALPVCECGNVPVARSLLAHGLKPTDVISFLFAAPILNPITIIATMSAFHFQPQMVWWRILFALVIVHAVATIVARLKPATILQPAFQASCRSHHGAPGLQRLLTDGRNEFWQLFTMLMLGAMIAAATQVFVPRDIINALGGDIILSVIAMIALGFIVSICSSVDAFFALAYASSFTTGSLLAFLLAGPMIDIKLIMLMKTTFRWRFILLVMGLIATLSLIIGVGVNLYVR